MLEEEEEDEVKNYSENSCHRICAKHIFFIFQLPMGKIKKY